MAEYRCPPIAQLASQFERGPVRLRLKQLLGIEFLLSVVEAGRSYPFDFICHALTGFRPRAGDGAIFACDGEALRDDLVLLAEELSASADIDVQAWPDVVMTVPDLARRFNVSTKTIFRWHRRGLVGWRFRFPDKRQRLAFPDRCVRRFVVENSDLVARGSAFSQLSGVERGAIVERARELVAGGERTVNAVARTVAGESGRAVETIRLILRQYDEAHPRAGIFNRSELQVEPDDQRLAVWEAYVDGASVETLAERFDRPLNWIYRTLTQMRARELRARRIEFVACGEYEEPGAEQAFLHDPALRNPHRPGDGPVRPPADLPPYMRHLFRTPLLSNEGERALFRKFNYMKHRADKLRREIDPETVSAAVLDRIEALLDDAARVKNQITQANLRLVVSIAKRHLQPGQDFFELVSDGNISLMRAIDKFDFTRGFKFSTYGSWAIMRNFARSVPERRRERERFQTGREELLHSLSGVTPEQGEDERVPAARQAIERIMEKLDDRERVILRQRFGLDNAGEPQTLEQIGQSLGVSKERIRQLEARAMTKLRSEFASEVTSLLGA